MYVTVDEASIIEIVDIFVDFKVIVVVVIDVVTPSDVVETVIVVIVSV